MRNATFEKRRANRLPGWAGAVLGVAAVVLLAGLVAPRFLPAEHYRDAVANLFERQAGRHVSFGKIRMTLLPRIGFVLETFRMENPQGFAQVGDFIAAQKARCTVAFWPLVLHDELRLTRLELVRPKVLLLKDGGGGENYTLSRARLAGPEDSSEDISRGSSQRPRRQNPAADNPARQLGEVLLRNADISWGRVDREGHVRVTVRAAGVNLELRHLALAPLRLDQWQGTGRIRGTRITLDGWKTPLTISGGEVTLRGGDLESSVTGDLGKVAHVEGMLHIADVDHPVAKFEVKTGNLDLDSFLADQVSKAVTVPRRENDPPVALPSASAVQPKGDLVAQGHLTAGRVHAGRYVLGPATADVRVYTDRLEIWPLMVRFRRGSVQISARTDRRQVPERFSANVQARNIDVDQILRAWPSLRGRVAGTGELDLQIFGSLDTAWLKSLWGRGQFVIRNGRIEGLDLASTALPPAETGGTGNTTFTAIRGDLAIRDQRVRSRDIHLYAPQCMADLRGSFDFDGALRYDGQVSTRGSVRPPSSADSLHPLVAQGAATSKQEGLGTVPFILRGTLRHPEVGPGHGHMDFSPVAETSQRGRWNDPPYPNLFGKQ